LEFKFVLDGTTWMDGPNLVARPVGGDDVEFGDDQVGFTPVPAVVTENGDVQQRFFPPTTTGSGSTT
jgi:hypothetical protein